ncbi:hypothetical protein FGIG_12063 [Fasciola gigantica]|uniref:Uncharacterized protein n=1 Tax=Fasciola gigantica TaxID=46835 RepID=A0A504ZA42_FASGI|nr:hypothetical protein FGIG_12063 [Fasciola gigantica]
MRRHRRKQMPVLGYWRTAIWRLQKASFRAAYAIVDSLNASNIDTWLYAVNGDDFRALNAGDDAQEIQAIEDEENSGFARTFHASEIPVESADVKEGGLLLCLLTPSINSDFISGPSARSIAQ